MEAVNKAICPSFEEVSAFFARSQVRDICQESLRHGLCEVVPTVVCLLM